MGTSSVVFQTATLLQVGLEFFSAPPKHEGKKYTTEIKSYWMQLSALRSSVYWLSFSCVVSGHNSDALNSSLRQED